MKAVFNDSSFNSIKTEFTKFYYVKNFAVNNHEKTLEDYRAQNVITEWFQFHLMEL